MSVIKFGHFVLTIGVLLVAVHGLGYIAERVKQPRIVGEILAGILLGPWVLTSASPEFAGQTGSHAFENRGSLAMGRCHSRNRPSGDKPPASAIRVRN